MRPTQKIAMAVTIVLVVGVVASLFVVLLHVGPEQSTTVTSRTSSSTSPVGLTADPYAHTAPATFALVSDPSVIRSDPSFRSLAGKHYGFRYASFTNLSSVQNSDYVVIVLNSTSSGGYAQPVYSRLGKAAIQAAYKAGGALFELQNVWKPNQSVFVLAGYSAKALNGALNRFFTRQMPSSFTLGEFSYKVNSTSETTSPVTGGQGPIMTALYDNYSLTPNDQALYPPYNYTIDFANVISYQPLESEGSESWQASGPDLPKYSGVCDPPPPPPDGKGICYGELIGMPVVQFGDTAPQTPVYYLEDADCSIGPIRCTSEMGLALSGCTDFYTCQAITDAFQLPSMINTTDIWSLFEPSTIINISSVFSLFNGSKTQVAAGFMLLPMPAVMPIPFSFSTNVSQLIADNVVMFSEPQGICQPLGSTCLPGCTMFSIECAVNYTLWALVSESSNIPQVSQELETQTNYAPLFYPITLSAPPTFENSTGVYSFSYWDVTTQINTTYYEQAYFSPAATVYVGGPVTARAVYTETGSSGNVYGNVRFAYWKLNGSIGLGAGIKGALVTVRTSDGKVVYEATTNAQGYYTTPTLSPGCYAVNASEVGFNFEPVFDPICVDGNLNDPIYEWGGFYYYALSGYLGSMVLPSGQYSGAEFYLWYPDGLPAANVTVLARTQSGLLAGSYGGNGGFARSETSPSGVASFTWTAGPTPGFYNITFDANLAGNNLTFAMPVAVLGFNLSLENSTLTAFQGSSVVIPISAGYSPSYTGGLNFPAVTAVLSASGVPTNTTASFEPNPLVSPWYVSLFYNPARPNSALTVNIGSATPPGLYTIGITSVFESHGFEYPVTNSAMLTLLVKACNSRLSQIEGVVLNFDGNPQASNVTVYSLSGEKVFSENTSTGFFSTGYTLPPGAYNVSAYLPFDFSHPYFSELVNTEACISQSVTLTPRAALNLQVLYEGSPSPFSNVTLTYPGGYSVNITTNSQGIYSTAYSLPTGNYTAVAYSHGLNAKASFTLYPAETTNITINVIPANVANRVSGTTFTAVDAFVFGFVPLALTTIEWIDKHRRDRLAS